MFHHFMQPTFLHPGECSGNPSVSSDNAFWTAPAVPATHPAPYNPLVPPFPDAGLTLNMAQSPSSSSSLSEDGWLSAQMAQHHASSHSLQESVPNKTQHRLFDTHPDPPPAEEFALMDVFSFDYNQAALLGLLHANNDAVSQAMPNVDMITAPGVLPTDAQLTLTDLGASMQFNTHARAATTLPSPCSPQPVLTPTTLPHAQDPVITPPSQDDAPEERTRRSHSMPDVLGWHGDPRAMPRRQKPRYEGDHYTPQWVRYTGQHKEGYCDSCQPGKWLQLKNSAYWYHKQFFHGVSSVSGQPFAEPLEQRLKQDVVEGLCHQCHQFVPICSSKRKTGVLWFRHAHKCHIYEKPKPAKRTIKKD